MMQLLKTYLYPAILAWLIALFGTGCTVGFTTGPMSYTSDSIPPGIAHVDAAVPGLTFNAMFDPVEGVKATIGTVKTLLIAVGMP